MLVICAWILSGGRVKTFQQSMEILLRWAWKEEEKIRERNFDCIVSAKWKRTIPLSVEQTFHYHTSTMQHPKSRSIVPLRRKYFLPEIIESSLLRGLLMTRLRPVENLFERPFKNKTWLIMYLLEIINSIIFSLNLFIPLKEK